MKVNENEKICEKGVKTKSMISLWCKESNTFNKYNMKNKHT